MLRIRDYIFEIALMVVIIVISVAGFWSIYFGKEADPQPHHHLHFATVFIWLGLLLAQLLLMVRRSYQMHRKVGLAVLIAGPLLVATTAMLAVRSAHKGLVSGEGDFMIIQNTMAALELGLLIFLAFLLKNRRKLHGSLLLSTTILFMGIAMFFAVINVVPQFKIEAFETSDQFEMAGITAQLTGFVFALLFFIRDPKSGWPYLVAGLCIPFNGVLHSQLASLELIDPLTEIVGSMNQTLTFIGAFVLMFSLLALTAFPSREVISGRKPGGVRPTA